MAPPFDNSGYQNLPIKELGFDHEPVIVDIDDESPGYRELVDRLEEEQAPWTVLCEAVRRGDEDMVRQESLYLDGPSTIRAKNEAILVKRPDLLRLLLERDSTIRDDTVAIACEKKDRDSVSILLEFGWPINHPVRFTASLLCLAVDDVVFMQWLFEVGADVNARNYLDESTLSIAIAHGSIEVARLLLAQGTCVTHGDLLHCAAERENQSEGAGLVEELVKRGADVNAYRHDNPVAFKWRGMSTQVTPLHIACRKRNMPVAQALLQQGADPCRKSLNAGKLVEPTPLDKALESKDQGLIELLQTHNLRCRPSL